MDILATGGVAGVIASLLFSFLKSTNWSKDKKELASWAIALLAGFIAAFTQDNAGADIGATMMVALASAQVYYKILGERLGFEAPVRRLREAVIGAGSYAELEARAKAVMPDTYDVLEKDIMDARAKGEITVSEQGTLLAMLTAKRFPMPPHL